MTKLFLIPFISFSLYAQSALEIAKQSFDKVSHYKSSISTTTMTLQNAHGVQNIRKLEIKKLENFDGDKSLLTFLYPNDLTGTKLLSFEMIGKDDKQWLYLPAIKRIKRISSRNKSGSFMASEFSYEDISSQNYKNYTYNSEVKNVKIDGINYFQIIRMPKDKHSGYSKQVLWIDSNSYLLKFGEYYDKRKKLLKKVVFSKYIQLGDVYRVHKIEMKNIQNKKSSTLVWDTDEIDVSLSKRVFSKRALK